MKHNLNFTLVALLLVGSDTSRAEQIQGKINNRFEAVYGSRGVLIFRNEDRNHYKDIILFNKDKTVFATISREKNYVRFGSYKVGLSGADLGKALLGKKYHFDPHEFYPEYGIIEFAYKTINAGRAEVYIDKEKTSTKFVILSPTLYSVESWKTYLYGAILALDGVKNPLKEKPSDLVSIKRINVSDDAIFRITKFEGDWAQVECFIFCESVCKKKYKGWIKWTDGKQPLLRSYYTC